jgi:hypothetical protein
MRRHLRLYARGDWQKNILIKVLLVLACILSTGCGRGGASIDPIADVIFYTHLSDQRKPLDPRSKFFIGERVRAQISLDTALVKDDNLNVWHIQWIRPDGRKRYKKQITHAPGESRTSLSSSIKLHARHGSGKYLLQVYYFRLLVHEERFNVLAAPADQS